MEQITELLSNGVLVTDEELIIYEWNSWLKAHTLISKEEARSKKLHEIFPNIATKTLIRRIRTTLQLGTPSFYTCSEGYLIPILNDNIIDVHYKYMQQSVKILPYDFTNRQVLITISDQTEAKETYHSLELQKNKIQHYLKVIDEHVLTLTTDDKGMITDCSQAFCRINGYSKSELIGTSSNIFRHPDTTEETYHKLWETIKHGEIWRGEIKNLAKDGHAYWIKTSIFPLEERDGKTYYQGIMEDITDKKKIEEMSITDALTNLYNRRHFNNVYPEELKRAKRHQHVLGFIILDIDHFKLYNDTYGHAMGDQVLQQVGQVIGKLFKRAGDFAFRMGGEEFGALVETDKTEDVVKLAEALRENIFNLNIQHENNLPFKIVTASVGVAFSDFKTQPDLTIDGDLLYKNADENLYHSKKSGRNQVTAP